MRVIVRDKYWERDIIYNDVIRIEEGYRTFKLIKSGGFSKEFDNELFSYVVNIKEVRHGKWNTMAHRFYSTSSGKSRNVVFCSECGEPSASGFKTPYCALCGAKMNTQ